MTTTFEELCSYMEQYAHKEVGKWRTTSRLKLKDGEDMSVQASEVHYCMPRANLPYNQYSHFEVWYGWENERESYVPVEVILECIDLHGGLVHSVRSVK